MHAVLLENIFQHLVAPDALSATHPTPPNAKADSHSPAAEPCEAQHFSSHQLSRGLQVYRRGLLRALEPIHGHISRIRAILLGVTIIRIILHGGLYVHVVGSPIYGNFPMILTLAIWSPEL